MKQNHCCVFKNVYRANILRQKTPPASQSQSLARYRACPRATAYRGGLPAHDEKRGKGLTKRLISDRGGRALTTRRRAHFIEI